MVKEGTALDCRDLAPAVKYQAREGCALVRFKYETIFVTLSWISSASRATGADHIAGEVS